MNGARHEPGKLPSSQSIGCNPHSPSQVCLVDAPAPAAPASLLELEVTGTTYSPEGEILLSNVQVGGGYEKGEGGGRGWGEEKEKWKGHVLLALGSLVMWRVSVTLNFPAHPMHFLAGLVDSSHVPHWKWTKESQPPLSLRKGRFLCLLPNFHAVLAPAFFVCPSPCSWIALLTWQRSLTWRSAPPCATSPPSITIPSPTRTSG